MTETKRQFLAALERRRNRNDSGPSDPALTSHDSHAPRQVALARPHKTRKADR